MLAKYVVVWSSIHSWMDICVKQVPGIFADSFSINFFHITMQVCEFCNRAEPCNCFHQPNVERRRDVSRSTVRHLCLLLNMNTYVRCLLRNLICDFILSRFRKSRPWNTFLSIVLRFYLVPSESAEVLLSEGAKGLLKMAYVHRDLKDSNPFFILFLFCYSQIYYGRFPNQHS